MKKMRKSLIAVVVMLCLVIAAQAGGAETSSAKTVKKITVAKIKGTTLSYHKAVNNITIMEDPQWENIVGYGKKKTIKMTKDTKFYLLNIETMKPYKVTKKKFIKNMYKYEKSTENGVTYYWGTYCKMTVKNGKCVKLVQGFQS
ncbi:MAG: hypothetical protein MR304_05865 [Eubacterium sp.]|nr:hypothetical protein [Eubacterium sp.]